MNTIIFWVMIILGMIGIIALLGMMFLISLSIPILFIPLGLMFVLIAPLLWTYIKGIAKLDDSDFPKLSIKL